MTREKLLINASALDAMRNDVRVMLHESADARPHHKERLLEALKEAEWGLNRAARTMHRLVSEMDSAEQAASQ
jgi:hypothetical protein